MEEALGIPSSGLEYIELPPNEKNSEKELLKEYLMIREFLVSVAKSKVIPEFQGKDKRINFINYGDTELVYVLTVGEKKYTLLLGQPATSFGTVKKEFDNLKRLGINNKEDVVVPIYYFSDKEDSKELFVTPYLYQARCIGVEETEWGMWVPEPDYHFQEFSKQERSAINSGMIAMLVKLYDNTNNLGIANCRLGGGDFILEKGATQEEITSKNVINKMKLIAARELISISFQDYINKLKQEFTKTTYYKVPKERNSSILINQKAKAAMTLEEIEKGIEWGIELKEKEQKQTER